MGLVQIRRRDQARVPSFVGFRHLPIELFRTERSYYVFDARNVRFIEVDAVAYDVLAVLRDENVGAAELKRRLPQHDAAEIDEVYADLGEAQASRLLAPYAFVRVPAHAPASYHDVLSQRMTGLTLSVTTQCNLACSYCIYGGQYDQHPILAQEAMTWETLQQALHFLHERSRRAKQVRLDFFGGEPLVAFHLIERGVRYFKELVGPDGPAVAVTIATNGTILSERILEFLVEHRVYVQFSIDGSRAVHDLHRTFKTHGRGSFDLILANLQRIHDRDPDYYREHMRMKSVITTAAAVDPDDGFFRHPLVRILVEQRHISFLNMEPNYDLARDDDYFTRIAHLAHRLADRRGCQTADELTAHLTVPERALFGLTLNDFFDVQALNCLVLGDGAELPYRKSCLTGCAEGNVDADGNISVCHKSKSFVIGRVDGDWRYDEIARLNDELTQWQGCKSCFVQRFCDLCFEKLDADDYQGSHERYCDFTRQRARVVFGVMLEVLERNPALWGEVDRIAARRAAEQEAAHA